MTWGRQSGLNPFFVRSSFQRDDQQASEVGIRVLIPSSSGLHFRAAEKCEREVRHACLNPFFVRSSFQRAKEVQIEHIVSYVLIPSSSGLHFRAGENQEVVMVETVLIPSSSGLHFRVLLVKKSFFPMVYKGGCRKRPGLQEERDLHDNVWGDLRKRDKRIGIGSI